MNTILKNICLASLVLCSAQPVQVMGASWWTTILGSATATTALAAKHGGWKENKNDIKLGLAGAALAAGVMYGGSRCSVYLKQREVSNAHSAFHTTLPGRTQKYREHFLNELGKLRKEPLNESLEQELRHWSSGATPEKIRQLAITACNKETEFNLIEDSQARWRSRYIPYTALLVPAIFYATTLSKTKLVPVS